MNAAIRIVWLGLALQACGDDGPVNHDAAVPFDAIDAPIVAYECPKSGTPPVCGTTAPPTAPPTGATTCNPLAQTGCAAGEKCTWILDQVSPPTGHIGCAPNGTVALGCACSTGNAGIAGYDDCVKGTACVGNLCKQICDTQGGAPTCASSFTCTGYQNVFETGGTRVAGLCDVTCDPLTQCTTISQSPNACGSTTGEAPTRGCYGISAYSCSPAAASTLALTDRMMPRTNSSGGAFLNGCAPGFIPFFYAMTGSTVTLCTGLCAALEIDNTPAHVNNTKGDPTAPAKLPNKAQPFTGDGTCEIGKKGSAPTSTCKFIWPYLDDGNGAIEPAFLATGLLDKLGVCFATEHFMYDSNNDTVPDKESPACNTLPPRSASTSGNFDDAADFGCQKMANSARVGPALQDIRVGLRPSVPLARHTFD